MAANPPYYSADADASHYDIDAACDRAIFYADFGLFYQVPRNSGTLFSVTNVIDTYVYRGLKFTGEIGMASAAGLYQSFVGFVLVITSNAIVRRFNKDNALY